MSRAEKSACMCEFQLEKTVCLQNIRARSLQVSSVIKKKSLVDFSQRLYKCPILVRKLEPLIDFQTQIGCVGGQTLQIPISFIKLKSTM